MLYIIQVGHDDASDRYIRNKSRAIAEAGLESTLINMPCEVTTAAVIDAVCQTNANPDCTAVMVQLPLPDHIDKNAVLRAIPADKDIDGLNPRSDFTPLTPSAIMRWLKEQNIKLSGKMVTILGRSELVGKPLANLMIDAGATVTVCNSKTHPVDRKFAIGCSDVVVSAVGKAGLIAEKDIRYKINIRESVFIDVGINRGEDGKLCGDISKAAADYIRMCGGVCTPVPGGVGKWTVRELVIRLAEMEGMNNGAEAC